MIDRNTLSDSDSLLEENSKLSCPPLINLFFPLYTSSSSSLLSLQHNTTRCSSAQTSTLSARFFVAVLFSKLALYSFPVLSSSLCVYIYICIHAHSRDFPISTWYIRLYRRPINLNLGCCADFPRIYVASHEIP